MTKQNQSLSYVIAFCALALLTSCGSRGAKTSAASPTKTPTQSAPQNSDRSRLPPELTDGGVTSGPLQMSDADRAAMDAAVDGTDIGSSRMSDSRDANRATDRESSDMRAANEREKQRAAQMWVRTAKQDREVLDVFARPLANDKSARKSRDRIIDLAKRVHSRKHDVSKSSSRNRAAKVHADLKTRFEEALGKTVGAPKECKDITAERGARGIIAGQDLVYTCRISDTTSYELNFGAYEGMVEGQPAAGFEIAHVEVSPSSERFRGLKAELEVVMVSSRAMIAKGADKKAMLCRTNVSFVRSSLRACDNIGGSGPVVDGNPCDGSGSNGGGNSGPCVTDVPVEGEVIVGDCDEDPCSSDRSASRRVNSRTTYRVMPAKAAPRAATTTVEVPAEVPAEQPNVPTAPGTQPVVDRCGPRTNADGSIAPISADEEDC